MKPLRPLGDGPPQALDHNFCLSHQRCDIRPVARLFAPASGVCLVLSTTEPGLQVYDGAFVDCPVPGLDGTRYGANAGLCLEPQVWPDAANHPDFPSAVLKPGETYRQKTHLAFSKSA
jgi:aldose 1-epimerase